MDDKVELLRRVPLFGELDEPRLQAIATLARDRAARAGEVLICEGEAADSFFVVVDGVVHVERAGEELRSILSGGFLGEVALVEGGGRTATATCATDCRLLVLGRFEFERVLASFPDVREHVLAAIARRTHAAGGSGSSG